MYRVVLLAFISLVACDTAGGNPSVKESGRVGAGKADASGCDFDWTDADWDCPREWIGTGDGCDCGCTLDGSPVTDPDCGPGDAGVDGGTSGDAGTGEDVGVAGDDADPSDAGPSACPGLRPLPEPISFGVGSSVGGVAQGDIDGDGIPDLALWVTRDNRLGLEVLFGDCSSRFERRWRGTVSEAPTALRDSASDTVRIADWDGDGDLDVLSDRAIARNDGDGVLAIEALAGGGAVPPSGIAVLRVGGAVNGLVRGVEVANGEIRIERCQPGTGCDALGGSFLLQALEVEIHALDLDRDGVEDLLVGGKNPISMSSWLLHGASDFRSSEVLPQVPGADLEIGDIDGDGFLDIVAQLASQISDFPSNTDVLLNRPDGLRAVQRLSNFENHNDAAALADMDGDGCLDYAQVGVDSTSVGLRRGVRVNGECAYLGPHDPRGGVDQGWEVFDYGELLTDGHGAVGVQAIDVTGDGAPEWVLRHGRLPLDEARLLFVEVP